jgi:hypothetical protein
LEVPPPPYAGRPRSPKSVAFPVVAMVTNSIVLTAVGA